MECEEIYQRLEQCKTLIKNWEIMEGIDFDLSNVEIDGLLVDKKEDSDGNNWEYSLLTTMYTRKSDTGRDVYAVRWRFKDLWGNPAVFSYTGPGRGGTLLLNYIDYGIFALVGFSIVTNDAAMLCLIQDFFIEDASIETDSQEPIFKFYKSDEISIVSVEKKAHLSLFDDNPS